MLATHSGRALLRRIEATLGVPTCLSESPRGFNDASLGAYADVARRADMVVLLGKALDFTLKFGGAPFEAACRFIVYRSGWGAGGSRPALQGSVTRVWLRRRHLPAGEAMVQRGSRAGQGRCRVAGRRALLLR